MTLLGRKIEDFVAATTRHTESFLERVELYWNQTIPGTTHSATGCMLAEVLCLFSHKQVQTFDLEVSGIPNKSEKGH